MGSQHAKLLKSENILYGDGKTLHFLDFGALGRPSNLGRASKLFLILL
jgi:hypothetical protein